MLADCRAGKLDLIITKSVSRFARNLVLCISIVLDLKALSPPVGVFFESESIFSLNEEKSMSLSFFAMNLSAYASGSRPAPDPGAAGVPA